jgi:hypothetical protein
MLSRHRFALYPLAALSMMVAFTACTESEEKEPDDTIPAYTIPASYSAFENVDFSGQTSRLDMMQELGAYVKTANKKGVKIDAAKMKAMFANEGNPFAKEALNTSGKKLKDKTFEPERPDFESLFDSAAAVSGDTVPGAKGKAGVVTASNGTSTYLMSAKGVEYAQLIEKGLMGALSFYQTTAVYLDTATKLGTSVSDSAKAHHWDEGFGYFTSSVLFPDSGRTRFWSKYSNDIDAHIKSNARILRAFAKGRAAIVNKDRKTMVEAIDSVRYEWERLSAATAIHYFNAVKKVLTDDGARNHQLTEGIAFVRALRYNPGKKIKSSEIDDIETYIGDDFYEVSLSGIDSAIDLLSGIYGLGDVKDNL